MTNNKPNILVSNDDGIDADGLYQLVLQLKKFSNVYVAAPHRHERRERAVAPPQAADAIASPTRSRTLSCRTLLAPIMKKVMEQVQLAKTAREDETA